MFCTISFGLLAKIKNKLFNFIKKKATKTKYSNQKQTQAHRHTHTFKEQPVKFVNDFSIPFLLLLLLLYRILNICVFKQKKIKQNKFLVKEE